MYGIVCRAELLLRRGLDHVSVQQTASRAGLCFSIPYTGHGNRVNSSISTSGARQYGGSEIYHSLWPRIQKLIYPRRKNWAPEG